MTQNIQSLSWRCNRVRLYMLDYQTISHVYRSNMKLDLRNHAITEVSSICVFIKTATYKVRTEVPVHEGLHYNQRGFGDLVYIYS
jgi:hypothetical protein